MIQVFRLGEMAIRTVNGMVHGSTDIKRPSSQGSGQLDGSNSVIHIYMSQS